MTPLIFRDLRFFYCALPQNLYDPPYFQQNFAEGRSYSVISPDVSFQTHLYSDSLKISKTCFSVPFWIFLSFLVLAKKESFSAQVYVDEMCGFQNQPPQKPIGFWGSRIFFGLKCRKFDSGTQVFCWTFFRHKHTYSNTPHPKKSICTHHRHKNRFQNFQKMAILAPKRCSNTAAKSVAFARLFKRKKFFLKVVACLYTTISQCFDINSSPGSAWKIMEAPL